MTKLIAEIGQSHEGSINLLKYFAEIAANCGVDYIKSQMRIPQYEASSQESFRSGVKFYDQSRLEYWKRVSLSSSEWKDFDTFVKSLGCTPLYSVFSSKAVEEVQALESKVIKLGSAESFADNPILEYILNETSLNIIASSGMSSLSDIDELVSRCGSRLESLLICNSRYPVPLDSLRLERIFYLRKRYDVQVGYSDHSGVLSVAMAALSFDISHYEFHFPRADVLPGPDVSSSLSPIEVKELGKYQTIRESARKYEDLILNNDDLGVEMHEAFGRSVGYITDFPKGHILTKSDFIPRRPATGIPWGLYNNYIGKELRKDVSWFNLMKHDDIHD